MLRLDTIHFLLLVHNVMRPVYRRAPAQSVVESNDKLLVAGIEIVYGLPLKMKCVVFKYIFSFKKCRGLFKCGHGVLSYLQLSEE